jgi:rubredoxin
MKCPNCGYKRQKRDDAFVPATECPSCGVVYSKHEGVPVPGLPISSATAPPPLRPSAVDPESLKKAKERVEKRLRGRLQDPVKDDRHAQTLELARKLTNSAARNRREKAAQIKTVEKEATKNRDPESERDDAPSDDPLLLEDAFGVQLYSGQSDVEPETSDEKAPIHEPTPDNDEVQENNASTDATEDTKNDEFTKNPNTAPPSSNPEDVQVETALLKSEQVEANYADELREPANLSSKDESMETEASDLPPAYIAAASATPKESHTGVNLKRLLPIIAWLILFSGLIGAVLSWTTITDVEAGVNIPGTGGQSALPLGLLLGFAYLATGALGFAFFRVSSLIHRQLKDIRRLLMVHPIAMHHQETGADPSDGMNHRHT